MEPASITGLIGFSIDCTILVYKYIKGLKDTSKAVSRLQEELYSLKLVLDSLDSILKKESHVLQRTSALFKATKKCNHDLKELESTLEEVSRGHRMRRAFHRMKWPLDEADTIKTAENVHRYLTIFQLSLTAEGLSLLSKNSIEVRTNLESLEDSTLSICSNVEEVKQAVASIGSHLREVHHEQEYSRFLDWLPTLHYQEKHLEIESRRFEGSGQWLLNDYTFRSWCENGSSNPTLFCHGGPGVGKTFLTSVIIDHLQEMCGTGDDKLAYLYLNYEKRSEQNAFLVACCLLKQILCQYPSAPKPARELFKKFQQKKVLPRWSTIRSILIETCSDNRNGKHFIVLDALDEYDEGKDRGEMLRLIRDLRKANVRLFVTSRPFPDDIMNCFAGASIEEVGANEADLVGYIKEKINDATRLRDVVKEKLIDEITDAIVAKAQGMFLLASLQIDYVLGQTTSNEVRKALKCLPSGLWANINHTMERIQALPHQSQQDLAIRTILWVSHSLRGLSVQELQHAVAITSRGKDIDEDDLVPEALLVEYCCGLVTVDSGTETIRLAHYSIYEYFQQEDQLQLLRYPHLTITKACLNYLEMDVFRERCLSRKCHHRQAFPLLDYATQHWGDHANLCQVEDIKPNVKRFLQDTEAVTSWALHGLEGYQTIQRLAWGYQEADRLQWGYHEFDKQRVAPLHVVARFGLLQLYVSLSTEPDLFSNDFNCRTLQGETPLIIASKYGHKDFVDYLLSGPFAVQANDVDLRGRSSLLWAVRKGHLDVVNVLVTYPMVDVNRGYPLLLAVADRKLDICASLIERADLNINATNAHGDTVFDPLFFEDNPSLDLVRVLLQRGDLDPRKGEVDHKILVLEGNEDIMTDEELLTFPLIIREVAALCVRRSRLENGDTFLHWFALWICRDTLIGKHSDIMLGWLNEGFEYSASDEMGFNILHTAALSGNEALLKKALQLGFDVNAPTKDGETVLHLAARSGKDSITPFLLSNATDLAVNTIDNYGHSPLFPAISSGGEVTARILLEAGVDANKPNGKGETPLLVSIWLGKTEVTRLLIDHGADVNRRGPGGWTPLHAATDEEHPEIMRLLLEHGAEVDPCSNTLGTPLELAAEIMDTRMVELLVQHGADPTKLGPHGRTPLDWASSYEPVFNAMGPARLSYQPTPKARMAMTLRKTIDLVLEEFLHGTPKYKHYGHLGHMLLFLGNREDAIRAFEMSVSWDDDRNLAVHMHGEVKCRACMTEIMGMRFICGDCAGVSLCSICFSKRAAPRIPAEDILSLKSIREEPKIEGESLSLASAGPEDGNSSSQRANEEANKHAKEILEKIPWCSADHSFIEVPGPKWMETKGASAPNEDAFEAWLREIKARYLRESEVEAQGDQ